MTTWSTRRKYGYFVIFLAIVLVVLGVPAFFFFYEAPTCSDGKMNGKETGIDCGGSCARLCPADFVSPRVLWSYSVRVLPGIYNSLSYIQNPNAGVEAKNLNYLFKLFDSEGVLVAEKAGRAFVPAGQKFAVFEGAINTGNRVPVRTTFEFTATPNWVKGTPFSKIRTLTVDLTKGDKPRADVSVKNESVTEKFSNISAYIVLYDKNDNRVSFSKTFIDSISQGETKNLYFTWPEAFPDEIVRTEMLFTLIK